MGNISSGKRDRRCSSDTECFPVSPTKEKNKETGKKGKQGRQRSSEEVEDFPTYTKEPVSSISNNTIPISVNSNETTLPTVFKWDGGGKEVYISGTFSGWEPIKMINSYGDHMLILNLEEGEHQYKYLVDGQWQHDTVEPVCDNGMGSKNNVIRVRKEDFQVFEALEMDSISTSGALSEDYSQEIPERGSQVKNPPLLPPHLLQIILNQEVSISCDPTLLPEPNHVMLNHLYALSIKDGVLVLSASHRYKKKTVTTVFYKPV
ncbi:5'-AMP-activated protein kinase subunit beta-1-like [Limulus polyphemus]|uniref:5'-AMP-activated protein kinase subunit beta-1 n=1 Tax=Limulus polyphemus TaxID=6850 RepID=A0ABM1SM86_LIMPO|nr:5'-AMP-activated protein kinase subunit beta-1-like [Limulus polyphemus]